MIFTGQHVKRTSEYLRILVKVSGGDAGVCQYSDTGDAETDV